MLPPELPPLLPPSMPPLMPHPVAAAGASAPDHCLNCAETLPRPRPGFCPACGQETTVRPPRISEFVQQFGGAYFATEGALWRTLKLLLFKPGELTRQYLAGRRKHYVLPLRLYLTVSLVVLLMVRVLGDGMVRINTDAEVPTAQTNGEGKGKAKVPRKANISILGDGDMGFGLKDGVFFCRQMPDWVCKRAKRRIDIDPQAVSGELERFRDRFVGNIGAAMFLLLPGFALWMKLAYWNRRLRYTEHLVFALHVHAFWFLAFSMMLADVWWLTALGCTAVPAYTWLAMHRVYGGRRWPRFLRVGLVSLLYLVMLTVALLLVALWTLLF